MTVKEGDVLAGKYRVDKVLGMGGMGVVVAGHHIQLDNKVAIKFMLPEALSNHEAVARFAREARAAVRIKSEHVARVTDVGALENGAPFMVMEYLEGSDLSAWLKNGPMSIDQAVEFVLQASEAIAEAHALGIVHRDLKPANLFVIRRPDGGLSVKVLDFGISKVTGPSVLGGDMTKTEAAMGSPLYMSPEQLQSAKDVDARSDIWGIGVILYELLTGESPFNADTLPSALLKIMQAPPPPLRNRRPDVPAELEAVILQCLEKDRDRRYPTIGAMAVALVQFGPKRSRASVERISGIMQGAGMSASALALPPSSEPAEQPTLVAGTAPPWSKTSPTSKGSKTVIAAAAAVVAVLGGTGWLIAARTPPEPEPNSVASEPSARAPQSALSAALQELEPAAADSVTPVVAAIPSIATKPQPSTTPRIGRATGLSQRPSTAVAPPASPKPSAAPTARQRALLDDR